MELPEVLPETEGAGFPYPEPDPAVFGLEYPEEAFGLFGLAYPEEDLDDFEEVEDEPKIPPPLREPQTDLLGLEDLEKLLEEKERVLNLERASPS